MAQKLVLIESPFSHPHEQGKRLHIAYLELCFLDAIKQNECPIATHKLYTTCLDDTNPDQRRTGMKMLETLIERTDYHAVYYDLGVSSGMAWGIERAIEYEKRIVLRSLYNHPFPTSLANLVGILVKKYGSATKI